VVAAEPGELLVPAVDKEIAAVESLHVDDGRGGVDQVAQTLLGFEERSLAVAVLADVRGDDETHHLAADDDVVGRFGHLDDRAVLLAVVSDPFADPVGDQVPDRHREEFGPVEAVGLHRRGVDGEKRTRRGLAHPRGVRAGVEQSSVAPKLYVRFTLRRRGHVAPCLPLA
jgi:hypothetical protein